MVVLSVGVALLLLLGVGVMLSATVGVVLLLLLSVGNLSVAVDVVLLVEFISGAILPGSCSTSLASPLPPPPCCSKNCWVLGWHCQ